MFIEGIISLMKDCKVEDFKIPEEAILGSVFCWQELDALLALTGKRGFLHFSEFLNSSTSFENRLDFIPRALGDEGNKFMHFLGCAYAEHVLHNWEEKVHKGNLRGVISCKLKWIQGEEIALAEARRIASNESCLGYDFAAHAVTRCAEESIDNMVKIVAYFACLSARESSTSTFEQERKWQETLLRSMVK